MPQSLTTILNDADPDHHGSLPIKIVRNNSAISIFPDGFGDFSSAPGHGCPVFLELYRGRLRLIVFADINCQDPTIIDIEAAREDRHVQCEERTPAR